MEPPKRFISLRKTYFMKQIFNTIGISLSYLCCSVFGHHYAVSKKVTSYIKEYKCIHCQREVTTDVTGKLSALTPELQEINDTLERLYQKKHRPIPAPVQEKQTA